MFFLFDSPRIRDSNDPLMALFGAGCFQTSPNVYTKVGSKMNQKWSKVGQILGGARSASQGHISKWPDAHALPPDTAPSNIYAEAHSRPCAGVLHVQGTHNMFQAGSNVHHGVRRAPSLGRGGARESGKFSRSAMSGGGSLTIYFITL